MVRIFQLSAIIFLLNLTNGCTQTPVTTNKPLTEILQEKGISSSKIEILIDKSDYKLFVIADTSFLKVYDVVFGANPVDDKLRQGDKCTPEGTFRVLSKYEHHKWSKFIWLDYPNNQSWEKHKDAIAEGKISSDSNIGGEIGIHGVPDGMDFLIDIGYNWTLGCIALKNSDINELYAHISDKTKITIRK